MTFIDMLKYWIETWQADGAYQNGRKTKSIFFSFLNILLYRWKIV